MEQTYQVKDENGLVVAEFASEALGPFTVAPKQSEPEGGGGGGPRQDQ